MQGVTYLILPWLSNYWTGLIPLVPKGTSAETHGMLVQKRMTALLSTNDAL